MSEEETIKRIEETLKLTELCQRTTNAPKISENYIWDMRTLLDLYNKEKEKNKIIFDENAHWKASYFKLSRKIGTVSKDKIKEILEKYLIENRKKLCKSGCYIRDNATSEQERIAGAINVLNKIKKELLEE